LPRSRRHRDATTGRASPRSTPRSRKSRLRPSSNSIAPSQWHGEGPARLAVIDAIANEPALRITTCSPASAQTCSRKLGRYDEARADFTAPLP